MMRTRSASIKRYWPGGSTSPRSACNQPPTHSLTHSHSLHPHTSLTHSVTLSLPSRLFCCPSHRSALRPVREGPGQEVVDGRSIEAVRVFEGRSRRHQATPMVQGGGLGTSSRQKSQAAVRAGVRVRGRHEQLRQVSRLGWGGRGNTVERDGQGAVRRLLIERVDHEVVFQCRCFSFSL
jgi:hypothetical protein